ncbi:MAG TPA: hypothetical protein VFV20_07925 [Candidatus Limnocylindria bacterium]|nr:hypothetical protein [Candidatus Limnocylindria bacterium]
MDGAGIFVVLAICLVTAAGLGLATATLFARATDAHAAEMTLDQDAQAEPEALEG